MKEQYRNTSVSVLNILSFRRTYLTNILKAGDLSVTAKIFTCLDDTKPKFFCSIGIVKNYYLYVIINSRRVRLEPY